MVTDTERWSVFDTATAYIYSRALHCAVELGVPEHLDAAGRSSVAELAASVGCAAEPLRRILRLLEVRGLIESGADARVGLTDAGRALCPDADGSLRDVVISTMQPAHWRAFEALPEAVRTGTSAFEQTHGMAYFDYLAQDPGTERRLNAAMVAMSTVRDQAVADAVWIAPQSLIVDVAGGRGALLRALLRRHPETEGVLVDRPSVAQAARDDMREHGFAGRCECVGGDIFEALPRGADVYVLSWILHDWDDERALRILAHVRSAMTTPGARLLIVEMVLPDDVVAHPAFVLDVNMLALTGGQERSESDYRTLAATSGLHVDRVLDTGGPFSILECS